VTTSHAAEPNLLPDLRWATSAGIAGLLALSSYGVLSALVVSPPVAVLLTFGFSFGLTLSSIALHLESP
jgi:hypothetical protein